MSSCAVMKCACIWSLAPALLKLHSVSHPARGCADTRVRGQLVTGTGAVRAGGAERADAQAARGVPHARPRRAPARAGQAGAHRRRLPGCWCVQCACSHWSTRVVPGRWFMELLCVGGVACSGFRTPYPQLSHAGTTAWLRRGACTAGHPAPSRALLGKQCTSLMGIMSCVSGDKRGLWHGVAAPALTALAYHGHETGGLPPAAWPRLSGCTALARLELHAVLELPAELAAAVRSVDCLQVRQCAGRQSLSALAESAARKQAGVI